MANWQQNYVGLGKETVYGTPVAPTKYIPLLPSDGLNPNMNVKFNEAIKGTAPKNKGAFTGLVELAGGFESEAYPNFIGDVLQSLLGAPSTALVGGETIVYKHTFAESLTKKSYTVEQMVGEIIKRYAGVQFKNLKVEAKLDEAVKVSFEGMGKGQATQAAGSPSYETTRAWNHNDVSLVKIGSTDITAKVREVSVEYDNDLKPRHAFGQNGYPVDMYPGQSEHKGKITMYVDSATKDYLEDYTAGTVRAFELKMEGAAIGNASKSTLGILATQAKFTAASHKIDQDYNMLELEYEAIEDPTDGIIKVELTNLQSSY